jgi:hypothetical protein
VVHNGNITDEYAKNSKILSRNHFLVFPIVEVEKQNTVETTETAIQNKKKRISKK